MTDQATQQPSRALFTVRQFSDKHPAFPPAGLRHLIFLSEERESSKGKLPGNGLKESGAILRAGRKVLIDEARFLTWLDQQNQVATNAPIARPAAVAQE